LPLAAKVLRGLMQFKRTREEWERVLSSELWGLDEVDRDQVERGIFLRTFAFELLRFTFCGKTMFLVLCHVSKKLRDAQI